MGNIRFNALKTAFEHKAVESQKSKLENITDERVKSERI